MAWPRPGRTSGRRAPRRLAHSPRSPPFSRPLAGGYEALKHRIFSRLRQLPNGEELCSRWRLPVMVAAAFGAEAVASALLCPLEVSAARMLPRAGARW